MKRPCESSIDGELHLTTQVMLKPVSEQLPELVVRLGKPHEKFHFRKLSKPFLRNWGGPRRNRHNLPIFSSLKSLVEK